jgi:germination protein M
MTGTPCRWARHLALLSVAVLAVGCGGSSTSTAPAEPTPSAASTAPTPSATPSSTPSPVPATRVVAAAYFMHGEQLQPVHRSVVGPGVGAAAVRALLAGPTAAERQAGLTTTVPAGTTLRSLDIAGGLATVDLSGTYASGGGTLSMSARLAQVVFTLTRVPTVHLVTFRLDGKRVTAFGGEGIILDKPVGRDRFEELSPAVLIESPTLGETVTSPLRVSGTANVFEAVLQLEVRNAAGKVLVHRTVHATSGTGTRGTFAATLSFAAQPSGAGTLLGFVYSAKDGIRQDITSIPVRFG